MQRVLLAAFLGVAFSGIACCVPSTREEVRVYGAFVDQVGLSPRGSYPTANRTAFAAHLDQGRLVTELTALGVPVASARELSASIVMRNRVPACPPFPLPSRKGIGLRPVGARPAMDRLADLWSEGWMGPTHEKVFLTFSRVGFSEAGDRAILYTGDRYHGSFWLLSANGAGWALNQKRIQGP